MRALWAPWRHEYLASGDGPEGCIFCHARDAEEDKGALVVHRSDHALVLLNLYPYTNGHLMIAPLRHAGRLAALDPEIRGEMMEITARVETALEEEYAPDGLNVGLNLGRGAGAGVPDHVHIHVLPRWQGDTNFMTPVAETRVLSEPLEDTWEKLRRRLAGEGEGS